MGTGPRKGHFILPAPPAKSTAVDRLDNTNSVNANNINQLPV
jgi:hypothetical protein